MNKNHWLKALLGTALLGAILFAALHWRSEGASGVGVEDAGTRLPFRPGDIHRYALTLRTQTQASGDTLIDYTLTGTWRVDVLRQDDKGVVLHARIEDARLIPAGRSVPADASARMAQAQADFARPVQLRLDGQGALTSVADDGLQELQVRSMVRAVAGVSQVSGEREGKARWEREEWDNVGRYAVRYERVSPHKLEKAKLRYTSLSSQAQQVGSHGSSLDVQASKANLVLREDGLLLELEGDETVVATGDALGGVSTTTHYSLRYVDSRRLDPSGLAAALLTAFQASSSPNEFARSGYAPETDAARIDGRSFEQVLEELVLLPPDRGQQSDEQRTRYRRNFVALSALLRREPEAADKALAQADKNPQLKRMLWDVLGSAGSPTAQAALVRSIEDPRWDREDRLHQMVALSMVEQPTEATVSFLQEQAESGEQAHQARLGLGIAADRLRQREPKRADAVVAALVQGLENAKTTIERRHYLTALGNTRHPDALEPILGFVEASDPHDRSAAMNALRFQRAEAAIAALSQGMLVDRDASVRAAAVQSAAYPPASPALLAALRDCAERDSEESVRRAANAALTQLDFRQGGSTQSR